MMYKKHKNFIAAVFITLFLLFFWINADITDLASDILTIVSITLGFYIAALTTMTGRSYLKRMNQRIDSQKKTSTELYTVLTYYRYSIVISIVTIFTTMGYKFLYSIGRCGTVYYWLLRIVSATIIPLVALSFIFLWWLFKLFINFIMYETK